MIWLTIIPVLIFVFWIGNMCCKWEKINRLAWKILLRRLFLAVYCILVCGTIGFGLFISTLMYKPEYVVERNGICMVASVNSFLQEKVYYYEYKNFLFRGAEQIGWEDYGNGGTDPLKQDGREPKRWYFEDSGENVIESSGEK